MIAELRTYTINGGMMDSYLELFNKQIVPNHRKYGIAVLGAWIDRRDQAATACSLASISARNLPV